MLTVLLIVAGLAPSAAAAEWSLRFLGGEGIDADRVKVRIDDPADALPGPPADVGARSFTLELWLRGRWAANPAGSVDCGSGIGWIEGNVFVDRDRYNQVPAWGASLGAGRVAFGVLGPNGDALTVCGRRRVLDGRWHHLALQRRRADGRLEIWVDGRRDAQGDGPDGDVSYPDDGIPGSFCPLPVADSPCDYSDPFLVLGSEKHALGPSFSGWLDEVRISHGMRLTERRKIPKRRFRVDGRTLALYRFNEGSGSALRDAAGGLSPAHRKVGGEPPAPRWSRRSPFR